MFLGVCVNAFKSYTGDLLGMPGDNYVHGYEDLERQRLRDQADTLAGILHHDTRYPPRSSILEEGCGVGAQTVYLAENNPQCAITSMDISETSINEAKEKILARGFTNVTFRRGDIFALPFADNSFDHVFVCFVLEHLTDPGSALTHLQRVLRPGGTLTVIEGDHGTSIFHPEDPAAWDCIQCLIDLQAKAGGNSLIGRQLYPLLDQAGLVGISVSPRVVYADESRPALVDGFTRKTYIAMVAGVRDQALAAGLITPDRWDLGMEKLGLSAEPGGVFYYTFFKAVARKPENNQHSD